MNTLGEKPEGVELQYGACRFCGQTTQLETDGRATQEQLDEWATEKCGCKEALIYRDRARRRKATRNNIAEMFRDMEEVREMLDLCVQPLQDRKMSSVTINSGNTKGTVKIDSEGNLIVERTETNKKQKKT